MTNDKSYYLTGTIHYATPGEAQREFIKVVTPAAMTMSGTIVHLSNTPRHEHQVAYVGNPDDVYNFMR